MPPSDFFRTVLESKLVPDGYDAIGYKTLGTSTTNQKCQWWAWNGTIETAEVMKVISKNGLDDPHCELEVELEWAGPKPAKHPPTTGDAWRFVKVQLVWNEEAQTFIKPNTKWGLVPLYCKDFCSPRDVVTTASAHKRKSSAMDDPDPLP